MPSRIRNKSSFSTDSFARMTLLAYTASPMLARSTMSDITTISSMSVNPRRACLPVTVLRSIEGGAITLRVDVEHVLSAPRCGVGLVLVRAQSPLAAVGHRVRGDPPQVFQLSAGRVVGGGDAFDQRLEIGRIALTARFYVSRRNLSRVDGVLESVDRRAHFTKAPPQLGLA